MSFVAGRGTIAFILIAASAMGACGGPPGSPAAPTAAAVPTPTLAVKVEESSASRDFGGSVTRYFACYNVTNGTPYGATVSVQFDLFGPDGTVYAASRLFKDVWALPARVGFVVGCGLNVYDPDLVHPVATHYRLSLAYVFEDGTTGTIRGESVINPSDPKPPTPIGIVISQFRTRGPNHSTDQFVELHNVSSKTIALQGWYVNFSHDDGTIAQGISIPNTTMLPGCYYLLTRSGFGTSVGYSGRVVGDASFLSELDDAGGMALFPRGSGGPLYVADEVGMSYRSLYYEGTPLAPFAAPDSDRSYLRVGPDTDDNSRDFVVGTSSPRNSSSACSLTSS